MASQPSWVLYTGDDKEIVFTVTDENDVQVDCTPATAIEYRLKHSTGTISKSLGQGIDIKPGTGGKPRVTLAGGDSKGLPTQDADEELDVVLLGKRSTVHRGKVSIVLSLAEPA